MKQILFRITALLLIAALALTVAACGDSGKDTEKKTVIEKETQSTADAALQQKMEKLMKQYDFSGAFIVSKNGEVVCEGANGTMGPDSDEPITVDSLFAIASVSKQFCATCVLLLREAGKLSLYDTLDKYYPEYYAAEDITLQQMLTMQSGIPDYVSNGAEFDSYIDYDFSDKATEEGNHQAVRDWIFAQPLLFEPGTDFSYSDSNYFLLAEIVERLSGKPYGDVLREKIFDPLGMDDTGVCEELNRSDRLAQPFLEDEDQHKEIETIGATYGNGGIITTVGDMDKWLTSLREYTILSEKCTEELTTDYSPDYAHYGYGICVNPDGSLYHDGACDSYASYAYTNPEKGYNFFIVTNDVNDGFGSLIEEIANATMD